MMINKNDNIQNKQLGRIIRINDDLSQITIDSSRYYKYKDIYYPSVTFVLSYYPKGENFNNFLKTNGENSDLIAHEAAVRGTNTHSAIEKMLNGEELLWVAKDGNFNYSLNEWLMINRFQEFWNTYKPKLIQTEYHIHSDIHKVAGTIDMIIELNEELWIIDIKTSNALHNIYELQTAIYKECWNENFDKKVIKSGILWLNARTRKSSNDPTKIQGKGWSLVTSDRTHEENVDLFKSIYKIFNIENPNLKPITEMYPNNIKLVLE